MNNKSNINTKTETAGSAEIVTPKLKLPKIAIPIGLSVFGLIILLFFLLFNQGFKTSSNKTSDGTNKEISTDVFIILTFAIFGIAIVLILLPNFSDIKKLLEKIMPTIYVFIYTIFFNSLTKMEGMSGFIVNLIFYIPCLLNDLIIYLFNQYKITPNIVFILIIIEIMLILMVIYQY